MTTTTEAVVEVPAACKPLQGGLQIPLTLLTPSPLNPRKSWAPERIARMAESLRTSGQVQPIRVRPNPLYNPDNGRPPYEIVVGETRWRAAPDAGLQLLDAVVGQYTDQQVIELALAENTQRRDLHPLEEADAYATLLRTPTGLQGYATVAELAAAVGASESHVYQRLKLRNLCQAGREAFLAGKFDAGVALLIARMPDAAEQATATADILAGWGGEPYSYRQAAAHLKRKFMLNLHTATFDTAATYQVAGPCAGCPKRSSAAPGLFEDVTGGDHCQDSRCFNAKVSEAHLRLLDRAKAEGHEVLAGEAARKVLPTPQGAPAAGYLLLSQPCPQLTDSSRTLRELLPAATKLVIVEHPQAPGKLVDLATEATARKALKARNLLRAPADPAPAPAPAAQATQAAYTPPPAAPAPAATPAPPAAPAPAGGKGSSAERDMAEQIGASQRFCARLARELHMRVAASSLAERAAVLRRVVCAAMADMSYEAYELLYRLCGWPLPDDWDADLRERAETCTERELGNLLVMGLVLEELTNLRVTPDSLRDDDAHTLALADEYGIDVAALWAQASGQTDDATTAWLAAQPEAAPQQQPTPPAAPAKARPPIKYRNPATGDTWTGRGLQPRWLKAALAEGRSLDDFLCNPPK